jgi:hypothetical protein
MTTTNISNNNSVTPLSVLQGGTGLNTCVLGDLFIGAGAAVISRLAIGVTNNVLVSGPSWSATSSPISSGTASTSITGAICTGYITTAGSLATVTLPAVAAVGNQIFVQGQGSGGWRITASAGDTIQYGTTATSSGGSLSSTNRYDNCLVVCIVANTTWAVFSSLSSGLTVA